MYKKDMALMIDIAFNQTKLNQTNIFNKIYILLFYKFYAIDYNRYI